MAGYIGNKSQTLVDGYTTTEADAEFVNDPNAVITVNGSNVGIGTSSPAHTLDVNGSISAPTTYTNNIVLNSGGATIGSESIGSISGAAFQLFGTQAGGLANNIKAFTNGASRLNIDSAGRVTMPYQPAFMAKTSTSTLNTGAGSTWPYPNASSYGGFNDGGHYNTSTNRFTTPVSGRYFFSAHCILKFFPVGHSVEVTLTINGGDHKYLDRSTKATSGTSDNRYSLGGSIVLDLDANDYVQVQVYASTSSGWYYESSSNFSGYLIG